MEQDRIYEIIKQTAQSWLPELRNPDSVANLYGLTEEDMIYDVVKRVLDEAGVSIEFGKDNCQVCHGENGGVKGNENRVNGIVMCDYCHAEGMQHETPRVPEGQ